MFNIFKKNNNYSVVYHACIQKSASQWFKKIFLDYSKDKDIEVYVPGKNFYNRTININEEYLEPSKNCIITPLYMHYNDFKVISKNKKFKAFYVFRDPRDLVVSRYFSNKFSHASDDYITKERAKLNFMSEDEGLTYMITLMKSMDDYFSSMIEWNNSNNSNILLCRYEDFIGVNQFDEFKKLFQFLNLEISDSALNELLNKNSFQKLSGRESGNENKNSHYRKGISGDWKNYFKDQHKILFKEIFGNQLIKLGYEKNNEW